MYTLHNVGDQALLVEFENEISMEVNRKVMALKRALEAVSYTHLDVYKRQSMDYVHFLILM